MSKPSMGARITSLGAAVLARVPGISHAPRPVRGEIVGVDLGGSAVKIARMRRRAGGAELLDFAEAPLDSNEARSPQARREAMGEALAALVRARRLKGRRAVGLVHGLDVILRRTSMPALSRADLHSALMLEAHKYVPFPPERVALDFEIVGPSANGPGNVEVLVAACDRERLLETQSMLVQAGLKPLAITVPPLAFRSVMRHTHLSGVQEVTAVFDVGQQSTHLCIFKRDELRFSRELSLGGQALTEALRTIIVPGQGALKLTLEEAERLKIEHGIPMGEDEKKVVGGVALANVAVMLRPTLERLVREIWSSFDYCNEEFFGESVQRVYLTGRGSRLRNFGAYLQSVLRVPVESLDPGRELAGPNVRLPEDGAGSLGFAPALVLAKNLSAMSAFCTAVTSLVLLV